MPLRALAFSLVALLIPVELVAQDPLEYSVAVQLVQEQRWAAALDQIQRLRKQYPGNPKVDNLEGLALLGSGDTDGAAVAFQRVLATRPPRVEYVLTADGRRLGTLVDALRAWAVHA